MSPSKRIAQTVGLVGLTLGSTSGVAAASSAEGAKHWNLGAGFSLQSEQAQSLLSIRDRANQTIWSTVQGQSFLSASSGDDVIIGSSGAFEITLVDEGQCKGVNITETSYQWNHASVDGQQVSVSGFLTGCGAGDTAYTAAFWVPASLPDRVAFQFDVHADQDAESPLNKVFLNYASSVDEDFYGLGAQASFASLKNQSIPIFSREQGVGRTDPGTDLQNLSGFFSGGDKTTTYTAVPQYISTERNAFYLSEGKTALVNFDFTDKDAVTVRYSELSVSGQLLRGQSILDTISKVSDYVGKQPPLPKWVDDGVLLGIQGGQAKVEAIVKTGLDIDTPVAAVWLQDWSGSRIQPTGTGANVSRLWWNWENDQVLYPNWTDFVQHLRDQYEVRTLNYINPFLANVTTKPSGYKRNLFIEADTNHYTIQNSTTNGTAIISSGPGLNAGIVDLTNPATRAWLKAIIKENYWGTNISGYMTDFGEYTPVTPDTKFSHPSSPSALVYHNKYPLDWATFHNEVIHELGEENEAVLFYRSASLGSQRQINLFWAGDQTITWYRNDGIQSVISILGHLGASGFTQLNQDVGGYATNFEVPTAANPTGALPRDSQLLGRWGELGAVSTPVFRTHEGNIPGTNSQFYTDSNTYAYFAHNSRLFKSLGPYRRKLLDGEVALKGYPLIRFPVFHHPEDINARNLAQSFYLGSDLFVAPVVDANVTEIAVYLPGTKKESYEHVWTKKSYHGGQTITVPAPYGQPPVFVVDGASSPELDTFLEYVESSKDKTFSVAPGTKYVWPTVSSS